MSPAELLKILGVLSTAVCVWGKHNMVINGCPFARHAHNMIAILECFELLVLVIVGNILFDYRRVKLLGVVLYYIIYRSHDPNLCRTKIK